MYIPYVLHWYVHGVDLISCELRQPQYPHYAIPQPESATKSLLHCFVETQMRADSGKEAGPMLKTQVDGTSN